MLRSFFKIALRNFKKQAMFSIINVMGLAVGLAASFVILVYTIRELSYEKHFADHDKVYRIATKFMTMGDYSNGPPILTDILQKEYPWVEKTCRVKNQSGLKVKHGDNETKESGLFVESDFFELFPYTFEQGDGRLSSKGIVLSVEFSRRLFGDNNPLGKAIEIEGEKFSGLYTVEGVVDLRNVKSHLNAPFWAARPSGEKFDQSWIFVDTYNYVKVSEGVDQATIQSAVDKIIENNLFPMFQSGLSFADWLVRDDSFRMIVQPLDDIYLNGTLRYDLSEGGNETLIYILLTVALGILFIAATNFINLSTARAVKRAKEVGIKKIVGSTRLQLSVQFLGESTMVCLLATLLSLGFSELIILSVERVVGFGILTSVFSSPKELVLVFGLSTLLGLIAGLYPAVVLSAFKPLHVLKSNFKGGQKSFFRNSLVVLQFSISTILVIGTIIIFQQLQFAQNRDVGFNKENLLVIDNAKKLGNALAPFEQSLRQQPGVINISRAYNEPGSPDASAIRSIYSAYIQEPVTVNRFLGDFEYPSTVDLRLVDGRFFDSSIASDSSAVIINETAARELLLENPIGEVLNKKFTVIGVIKDFNFESVRKPVTPTIIEFSDAGYKLVLRLESQSANKIVSFIESEWQTYSASEPIRYHFLDENFSAMMRKEQVMGEVLALFTLLAIFVACLGLYGLSAYLSTQREKEIGIRKVIGASVFSVLGLFVREYSKLIFISLCIAIPASAYVMQVWLSGFAYKIGVEWWVMAVAGFAMLIIALSTVSYHAIRASLINPAETLRSE